MAGSLERGTTVADFDPMRKSYSVPGISPVNSARKTFKSEVGWYGFVTVGCAAHPVKDDGGVLPTTAARGVRNPDVIGR